jgi:stage II sporulation protein AB (anti-sigma F factor)
MIKAENQFELTLPALSENEGFARQCVTSFLARFDPTVSELADLRTAVSEAVTNCVVHGYKGKEGGLVYISVRCFSGRKVVIRIKDQGCGMADPEKCRQPLYTTDQSGERGGMGFAIMESFTDKMKVKTAVGKGTTVTLMKKLS